METEEEKQKVVLILGNGFDLDMHYVTKYGDFVESAYFAPMVGGKIPDEILIQEKDASKMQIVPNGLARYITDFEEHNKWVDLELCVRDYCKKHVNDTDTAIIEKEFYALRFFLYNFISRSYRARIGAREIGRNNTEVSYVLIDSIAHSKTDWNIWSFNYTKICEDLLKGFGVEDAEINNRVHHIHGTIYGENDNTNIVLGTGYDGEIMKVCPEAIKSQWKNYTQLKTLYDKHIQDAEHIIIMGHSVGDTDAQYFRGITDNAQLKTITILTDTKRSLNRIKQNLDEWTNSKFGTRIEDGNLKLIPFTSSEYTSIDNYYELALGQRFATKESIANLKTLLESYNAK